MLRFRFHWCEGGESNPYTTRVLDPKSSASANSATLADYKEMVGHVGLEPTTLRLKGGCSTTELMAHENGWGGWIRTNECRSQSPVPYHLATPQRRKVVEGAGFEPAKALPADLQSAPFSHLGIPPRYMEPTVGLEPATY